MATEESREELKERYKKAAQEYFREHMDGPAPPETVPQAKQRQITLASLALVKARRLDVHVFNELLIRYPGARRQQAGEVVSDNMVVVHQGKLNVYDTYDISSQPRRPLWVLDYICDEYPRKSYDKTFEKYERTLKVPYCLTFKTDDQELTLYHHNGQKYVSVKPNALGRYPIPELEMEVALLDGWGRYWFRGELLLLPAEMKREIDELRRQLTTEV